jgi:hypothetical protein
MRSSMQQKRNLSIHEYLSANLLKSVCDADPMKSCTSDMCSMASVYPRVKLPGLERKLRRLRRVSVHATVPALPLSLD